MSALGHEQKSRHVRIMSVLSLKADIRKRGLHVRFVPEADMAGLLRGKLSVNIRVLVSIDSNPELHTRVRRISARKTHAASGTGPDLLERN